VIWRVLAIAVIALHFAFLGFVVFGGFLAWRWPRIVWLHLAALGWSLGTLIAHYDCPLTTIEDSFLRRAGDHPNGQFVDRYVKGYVVPHGHDGLLQAVAALVIAISYVGFMRRRAVRRARSGAAAARAGAPGSGTATGTTP
jgi:hypothetical protein